MNTQTGRRERMVRGACRSCTEWLRRSPTRHRAAAGRPCAVWSLRNATPSVCRCVCVEPSKRTCCASQLAADAHSNPCAAIVLPPVMEIARPLDLLLMPGLGFDPQGGRLGRGGG